ncbi:MAG: four helix bundle protein [bacterium]|nr:four helix bundle protein [bacterium]
MKERNQEFILRVENYTLAVIDLLRTLPKDYIFDTIGRQLIRSATSIGANIIEAQAAASKKDFANFFNIALKSANETKYWIRILSKLKKGLTVDRIYNETEEISKILGKSLLTMRGK